MERKIDMYVCIDKKVGGETRQDKASLIRAGLSLTKAQGNESEREPDQSGQRVL
jgi:hypothetical protein